MCQYKIHHHYKIGGNEYERMGSPAQAGRKKQKDVSAGDTHRNGYMNDPFAPIPNGTKGTVVTVDDIGQLIMAWDNGQTLAVNTDEDSFHVITGEKQDESMDNAPVMRM